MQDPRSSLELLLDIHATVDHPDDGESILIDDIEHQMAANNETPDPCSKTYAWATQKRKTRQVRKAAVEFRGQRIGRRLVPIREVLVDAQKVAALCRTE
jgi:hypothetical protein